MPLCEQSLEHIASPSPPRLFQNFFQGFPFDSNGTSGNVVQKHPGFNDGVERRIQDPLRGHNTSSGTHADEDSAMLLAEMMRQPAKVEAPATGNLEASEVLAFRDSRFSNTRVMPGLCTSRTIIGTSIDLTHTT